jgi:hypothetical protein
MMFPSKVIAHGTSFTLTYTGEQANFAISDIPKATHLARIKLQHSPSTAQCQETIFCPLPLLLAVRQPLLQLLDAAVLLLQLLLLGLAFANAALQLQLNLQQNGIQYKDSRRDGSAWGGPRSKKTGKCRVVMLSLPQANKLLLCR